MEHNYKLLGLDSTATEAEVKERYDKLKKNYNPDNFKDPAQKKHAEKSLQEITKAYNAIIEKLHPLRSGTSAATQSGEEAMHSTGGHYSYVSQDGSAFATQGEYIPHVEAEIVEEVKSSSAQDRREFYDYVRRMIQNGEYDTATSRLNSYSNINDAEWQFLMGSAMYYNGFVSDSYNHFKRAAELAPNNREYTAMFSRMNQSRRGSVYSSPYNRKDLDKMDDLCDDACSLLQCLMCISCLRH